MATAVRIQKLDSGLSVIGTVNFDQKEITDVIVSPVPRNKMNRLITGKPKLHVIYTSQYRIISLSIRIYGEATENKLTELRNYIRTGEILRIYYKFVDDNTLYLDGFIDPDSLPLNWAFSGYPKAGDILNIIFHESDQAGLVVMDDDLIIT